MFESKSYDGCLHVYWHMECVVRLRFEIFLGNRSKKKSLISHRMPLTGPHVIAARTPFFTALPLGGGDLGFRHEDPADSHGKQRHPRHDIEPRRGTEALGYEARDCGTERRANAADGSDDALPEVEPSGTLRYVSDDQRS